MSDNLILNGIENQQSGDFERNQEEVIKRLITKYLRIINAMIGKRIGKKIKNRCLRTLIKLEYHLKSPLEIINSNSEIEYKNALRNRLRSEETIFLRNKLHHQINHYIIIINKIKIIKIIKNLKNN